MTLLEHSVYGLYEEVNRKLSGSTGVRNCRAHAMRRCCMNFDELQSERAHFLATRVCDNCLDQKFDVVDSFARRGGVAEALYGSFPDHFVCCSTRIEAETVLSKVRCPGSTDRGSFLIPQDWSLEALLSRWSLCSKRVLAQVMPTHRLNIFACTSAIMVCRT